MNLPRTLSFLVVFCMVFSVFGHSKRIRDADALRNRIEQHLKPRLMEITFDLLNQHRDGSALAPESFDDFSLNTDFSLEINDFSLNGSDSESLERSLFELPSAKPNRTRRQAPDISFDKPEDPPSMPNPHSFMHSFVADSGIGNRELIRIAGVQEQQVIIKTPQPQLAWYYSRFNSSDHVAARQANYVHVWRQEFPAGVGQLAFDSRAAICSLHFPPPKKLLQALFYTRVIEDEELLHLAITLKNSDGKYLLLTYEIVRAACIPSLTVELDYSQPIRLVHLRSHYFGALALLLNRGSAQTTPTISPFKKRKEISADVLAIYAHAPTDLEPFNMHGFAYLAVSYSSGVDIFKFDEFLNRHSVYQRIALSDVRDVLAFQSGVQYHLALATGDSYQHLFSWQDGSFNRQQLLRVSKALQWVPLHVHTCRDDLFVGLLRDDPAVPLLLYQWNTATHHLQLETDRVQQFIKMPLAPIAFSQTTFSYNSTAFLLQPDLNGRTRLFAFTTVLQHVADPIFERQFQLSTFIQTLHARLAAQQASLQVVRDVLGHAINLQSPRVNVPIDLRRLQSSVAVHTNRISFIRRAHWQGTSLTMNDASANLSKLQNMLLHLLTRIRFLAKKLLDQAWFSNSPQSVLVASKEFIGPVVLDSIVTPQLNLQRIANYSVSQLFNSLWLYDYPQLRVIGLKRFMQPPIISGNLDTHQWNDLIPPFATAVSTFFPSTITGDVVFANTLFAQTAKINLFNGLHLENELIMLNSRNFTSPQIVRSSIVFQTPLLTVEHLTSPSINNVDLVSLHARSLTTDSKEIMQGPLHVRKLRILMPSSLQGLLNGVNLPYLANSLVRVDQLYPIQAIKIFTGTVQAQEVNVYGTVNNLRFPTELASKDQYQKITGIKSFPSVVSNDHLIVQGKLNGFVYPHDVITLSGEEELNTPLNFENGLSAAGDIFVHGLTDGLQLNKFAYFMDRREMVLFGRTKFEGPVHIRGDLHVDGLISGQNLTSLAEQLLQRDEIILSCTGVKTFTHPIHTSSGLFTKTINNYPTSLLVDTMTDAKIVAPVLFKHASFEQLQVPRGLINDIHVASLLQNSISLSQSGPIAGNKHFDNMSVQTHIKVHGTVNGLQPERDFVFTKRHRYPVSQQVTSSKVKFAQQLRVSGELNTNHLKTHGLFSGVNITTLVHNRIPIDQPFNISYSVIISNSSSSSVRLINSKLLNGQNLVHLRENLLRKGIPSVITGRKHFNNQITLNAPSALHLLNNVSIQRVMDNALRSRGNQQILGNLHISGLLNVQGAAWTKKGINGISFPYLDQDTPRLHEKAFLDTNNEFLQPIRVDNNLITQTLDSLRIPQDIVLLRSSSNGEPLELKGSLSADKVRVSGSIQSSTGLINGIHLASLEQQTVRSDRPNVIPGDLWINQSVLALGEVQVRGLLAGVNLTKLVSAALNENGNQEITHLHITSEAPVTFSQLHIQNVNGIPWSEFLKDVVFVSRVKSFQDLGANKVFRRVRLIGQFQLPAVNMHCPVNGLHLDQLFKERIPLRSNQPVHINSSIYFAKKVYFYAPVQLLGPINGLNLHRDLLRLDLEAPVQQVTGFWSLDAASFNQDINLVGYLNGRSVSQLLETTLFKKGNQTITGIKHLRGPLQVISSLKVQELNKQVLKKNQSPFVTLETIGDAPLIFEQPLFVSGIAQLNGLLDGINLTEWIKHSLHLRGDQICPAQLRLDRTLVNANLIPLGPVNGIDLINLLYKLSQLENSLSANGKLIKQQLTTHLKLSRDLLAYIHQSTLQVYNFKLIQQLPHIFGDRISRDPLGIYDIKTGFRQLTWDLAAARLRPFTNVSSSGYFKRYLDKDLQVDLPPPGDEKAVLLKRSNQPAKSLGANVDVLRHLRTLNGKLFVATLSGITGKLTLYLVAPDGRLMQLSQLNVGPEAIDVALFEMESTIYVAIARSFTSNCPIADMGSLLFRWHENKRMQLVQRFSQTDVQIIRHVQFNDNHFLILYDAQPSVDELTSSNRMYVYRRVVDSRRCQFTLTQSLYVPGLRNLNAFVFGPTDRMQLFLVGIGESRLNVWKYAGHSGFETGWTIELSDGRAVEPLLYKNNLHLLVAQGQDCTNSLLYQAITSGAAYKPIKLLSGDEFDPKSWRTREVFE